MKYEYVSSFFFGICIQICFRSVFGSDAEKRFIVISSYRESGLSYPDIRPLKPQPQPALCKAMKRQICEDIFGSFYFRSKYERPVGIDNCCCPLLDWLAKDAWPAEDIKVKIADKGEEFEERAFLCTTIYRNHSDMTYQISDEYNLNANQPDRAHIYMPGRFVFFNYDNQWLVYVLAELAGEAYSSPDHDIERLYLRRRETREQKDNVLCRLAEENKRRICVAVFNSEYFSDTVSFNYTRKVVTDCQEQSVSFQTEFGEAEATAGRFKEWMLDCKSIEAYEVQFEYLLSHSYEFDQIFVYFRHKESGKVFPENLTTNVRLSLNPTEKELEAVRKKAENEV